MPFLARRVGPVRAAALAAAATAVLGLAPPERVTPTSHESCDIPERLAGRSLPMGLPELEFLLPPRPKSRSDADRALAAFSRAAERSPGCAAPLLERGLLKLRLDGTGWPPKDLLGQELSVPWWEQGLRDLATAGGRERQPYATVLAAVYMLDRVGMDQVVVDQVAPGVHQRLEQLPIVGHADLLARARLAELVGAFGVAASHYDELLGRTPGDPVVRLHATRNRLLSGDGSAAGQWYAVAASPDPAIRAIVSLDIEPVADAAEQEAWAALPGADRETWLRRFWGDRAARSFQEPDARLAEHYRRLAVAQEHFRIRVFPRRYETYELWRHPDSRLDDRGLIYVRHGPPDTSVTFIEGDACFNASWKYDRAEGPVILHFMARTDVNDWRLVETLANLADANGATNRLRIYSRPTPVDRETSVGNLLGCARPGVKVENIAESRGPLDPIYWQLALRPTRMRWERELAITTASREVATTTDGWPRQFTNSLGGVLLAYGLAGDDDRQGRVLLVGSFDADALQPEADGGRTSYRFEAEWFAVRDDSTVRGKSGLAVPAPRPLRQGESLGFPRILGVPTGELEVGVLLVHPARDAAISRTFTGLHVPLRHPAGADVSDLVLGRTEGGIRWETPAGTVHLNPRNVWARTEPVAVYYEVTGIPAGSAYQVELTLGEGRHRQRLRTTARSDGTVDRVIQTLDLRDLGQGTHELVLTIEAPGAAPLIRRQFVNVE